MAAEHPPTASQTSIQISGIGLITGKPVTATIHTTEAGHGIVFYCGDDSQPPIPARLESVVHTDRGVTLANRAGQTLSIVEHFLAATAITNSMDLKVVVQGAPEMPILQGCAQDWIAPLRTLGGSPTLPAATVELPQAVYYKGDGDVSVYALPASHFKISYAVDFNHPELSNRWALWDSQSDDPMLIASAGTFGYMSELPAMQARGLAMGVQPDNTLGLIEEGGYTRPLRHPDEPIYHKMLDLLGDLSLSGINPLTIKMHVFALNAGHGSHTAFAKQLNAALAG